jgi:uncharacterized membrane protein
MDTTSPTLGNNQDKLAAIISCVPILFWVPIVLDKKTAFVSHFMKHGFGLLVVGFILSISMNLLGFLALFLLPLAFIINIAILIAMLYLMYSAYTGKQAQIPYFTENLNKVLTNLGISSWFDAKK